MERLQADKQPTRNWDEYYKRTHQLPEASRTKDFLKDIPKNAHVLDIGSGNGRWAAAFLRDRPDITIDLVDANPPSPDLIADDWRGKFFEEDLKTFKPTKQYDAMWAYHSLFFMPPAEIKSCFHNLVSQLKPSGQIFFTMRESGFAARLHKYYGLDQEALLSMIENEGLELTSFVRKENERFGQNKDNVTNVFYVRAKKK